MAQLILTCCKREQAEQSWVCGWVLANVSTSLAWPCGAHRLIGSEAVVQSPGMFPLSLFLSLHALSSPHQYLYFFFFIASPFPALSPKRMMHSIVLEWCHHWQANESLQSAKNGANFWHLVWSTSSAMFFSIFLAHTILTSDLSFSFM